MAYRRSKGKARRKLQPAVMQIALTVPNEESYVDLALCASILNRRGYKQQCTKWAVAGFEVFQPAQGGDGALSILKAPETWIVENAYNKSKALYDRMNDQVLDLNEGIQGKYADFKIGLDSAHVQQDIQDTNTPTGRILTPVDGNGGLTSADFNGSIEPVADWDFSTVEIPNALVSGNTIGYKLHLVGGSTAQSKGMIAGYQLSRSRPNLEDPNVPTQEGWMSELFDDGENYEDIRDNLVADNDRAPYPVGAEGSATAYYAGGPSEQSALQIHSFCNFTSSTVSGKNSIMGGTFDYGLMKFVNTTGGPLTVIIHMLPGTHRGYAVEMI